ncbi:MAG: papain-like cysteine protease family protein [Eubacteriales bacterium]|nr:papain-like cysteine protease family protein [Eubacteriales bacterium]
MKAHHPMTAGMRIAALLAGVMLLSSCAVIKAPAATSTPQPALLNVRCGGYTCPQIGGIEQAADVNEQIYRYYETALRGLPAQDELALVHRMDQTGGYLALSTTLQLRDGTVLLRWPSLFVAPNGALLYPVDDVAAQLSAAAGYLDDMLWMRSRGLAGEYRPYDSTASTHDALALLVEAYEYLAGGAVDDAGIDAALTDTAMRKAIAVGITHYPSFDPADSPLSWRMALDQMTGWLAAVDDSIYGRSSDVATARDAQQLVELYEGMLEIVQDGQPAYTLPDSGQVLSGLYADDTYPLNRAELAKIFVTLYEQSQGEIVLRNEAFNRPGDTDDVYCRKAMEALLMYTYPSYDTFTPDLPVRINMLPGWVLNYLDGLDLDYQAELHQASPDKAQQYWDILYGPVPYQRVLRMARRLIEEYEDRARLSQPPVTRINDRPYDWYMDQEDTGPYSSVNCMPTAAAMAIKWYHAASAATPQQLRDYYPYITEGWTIYPVEETLDRFGIPYQAHTMDLQQMIALLDDGNILFCQVNAGNIQESGHCVVVYGYEKRGDSLWFILQDPADEGTNAYGRPLNAGRRLEANYVYWIIQRFTAMYLSIPAPPAQ